MRIKFDNRIFEGTAKEIVEEMNEVTWYSKSDIAEYMRRFAQRMWKWSRSGISLDNPELFLKDLSNEGVIEILDEGGDS